MNATDGAALSPVGAGFESAKPLAEIFGTTSPGSDRCTRASGRRRYSSHRAADHTTSARAVPSAGTYRSRTIGRVWHSIFRHCPRFTIVFSEYSTICFTLVPQKKITFTINKFDSKISKWCDEQAVFCDER